MNEFREYRYEDDMPGLRDRCLLFLHIPKTAGTSFRDLLERRFKPEDILPVGLASREDVTRRLLAADRHRLVHGHISYDAVNLFDKRPFLFTMLRDPIARAVSAFYYAKRHGSSMQQLAAAGEISPERASDYMKARDMTLAEFVRTEPRAAARHLGNLQVEFLTCADLEKRHRYDMQYDIAVSSREVDLAMQRLSTFDAFGLMERLPESVEYLTYALQTRPFGELAWSNAALAGIEAIDPETMQALQELTRHDQKLYAFATELFERRRREMLRTLLARHSSSTQAGAAPKRQPVPSSFTAGVPLPGEGWYAAENDGVRWFNWTGPSAQSWIELGSPSGTAFVLRVWVVHALKAGSLGAIVLLVNGVRVVAEVSLDPLGHMVTAAVPANLLRGIGESNRITFLGFPLLRPCDVDPTNHDSRAIGIAVHRIALESEECNAQKYTIAKIGMGDVPSSD